MVVESTNQNVLADLARLSSDLLQRTFEQEKRIDEIQTQITEMVPDCADRFKQALEQDAPSQQTM